jgi:hypothetical protein
MRILPASDSEECVEVLAKEYGKEVDVIFESYAARNLIEIRDYMQTLIGRSLISHIKGKACMEHHYKVLPTEALYSDTMEHVKSYEKYRKDFKE